MMCKQSALLLQVRSARIFAKATWIYLHVGNQIFWLGLRRMGLIKDCLAANQVHSIDYNPQPSKTFSIPSSFHQLESELKAFGHCKLHIIIANKPLHKILSPLIDEWPYHIIMAFSSALIKCGQLFRSCFCALNKRFNS